MFARVAEHDDIQYVLTCLNDGELSDKKGGREKGSAKTFKHLSFVEASLAAFTAINNFLIAYTSFAHL